MKTLVVIFLGLSLVSCREKGAYDDARKYGEALGSLIEDPVKLEVSIDKTGFQRVYASGDWEPRLKEVSIGAFTLIDNGIVAGDDQEMKVYLLDKDGAKRKSLGRKGEGPGEFLAIDMIEADSNYIYIYDGKLSRLTVLDHTLVLLATIPKDWNSMDRLMWCTDKFLMISERDNKNFLVSAFIPYPKLIRNKLIVPRLLPVGIQPMAMNNMIITGDENGNVFTVFSALPYIIRFNSMLDHVETFQIDGSEINDFYEVPSKNKPLSINGDAEHVRMLNSAMTASQDTLFLIIRGRLTLLDLTNRKQINQYVFYRRNGFMLSVKDLRVSERKLYILNRFDKNLTVFDLEKNELEYLELTSL